MHPRTIAMICHEVNRAYCEALNDHSLKPWDETPSNIQDSAVDGVKFHLANPTAGPEASHDHWMEFKRKDGWCYGPIKSGELRTHPCFVPFNELPTHQQAKDYIFREIVHQLGEL